MAGLGISSDSFDQAVQFGSQGDIELTQTMREKGIGLQTAVTSSVFYMGPIHSISDYVGNNLFH